LRPSRRSDVGRRHFHRHVPCRGPPARTQPNRARQPVRWHPEPRREQAEPRLIDRSYHQRGPSRCTIARTAAARRRPRRRGQSSSMSSCAVFSGRARPAGRARLDIQIEAQAVPCECHHDRFPGPAQVHSRVPAHSFGHLLPLVVETIIHNRPPSHGLCVAAVMAALVLASNRFETLDHTSPAARHNVVSAHRVGPIPPLRRRSPPRSSADYRLDRGPATPDPHSRRWPRGPWCRPVRAGFAGVSPSASLLPGHPSAGVHRGPGARLRRARPAGRFARLRAPGWSGTFSS